MFSQFLVSELFAFLLLFTRVGAALMVMPGFGEVFVSPRIRLILALMISLALGPRLTPYLPALPSEISALVALLATEVLTGLFIGAMVRVVMSAMHIAATIIATQSGFANAMMFDLTMSGQTTALTNLLSFTSIVVVFSLNLHHAMLMGIVASYDMLPVGAAVNAAQLAETGSLIMSKTLVIALQIASPFIVAGIILNLGGGILSRLMPNLQIFFILMSPQIMLALFVLMVSASAMMLLYAQHVEDGLNTLFTPA